MRILRFEELTSTSDRLREMAEQGAPAGTVVTAARQTAGRGRRGRQWHSPDGGLYMSILLRPAFGPDRLPRIPLLSSLALYRAISAGDERLTLKWPNDLLYRDRKLAGVLPETRSTGRIVHYMIIGFGVNLSKPRAALPPELVNRTAWLDEFVPEPDREAVLRAIVRELSGLVPAAGGREWEAAREEWASKAAWGREYVHRDRGTEIQGVTVGLDEDGGLILDTTGGRVTVTSGELL